MKRSPSIGVVVPLYNKRDTILRAIESISLQDLCPAQVIIVDDGSTDGSSEIAKEACNKFGYIYKKQENAGVSAARNSGVNICGTDFICFLDADDEWLPNHVSTVFRLVTEYFTRHKTEPALVSTRSQKSSIRNCSETIYPPCTTSDDFFRILSHDWNGSPVNSSTACVNKAEILHAGGFPVSYAHGEDIYMWLRIGLTGRVALSEVVTAIIHEDAVVRASARNLNSLPFHIQFFARSEKGLTAIQQSRALRAMLQRSAFRNGISLSVFKDFKLTINYITCTYKFGRGAAVGLLLLAFTPRTLRSALHRLYLRYRTLCAKHSIRA